ncbi:MAG: hypothetical protein KAJ15_05285 [Spirochaetes bacterium]|nr:hypothetical protein [Spirochaetota bacterium]
MKKILSLLILCLLFFSCATYTVNLKHAPIQKSVTGRGELVISEINNLREADYGAGDFKLIGKLRGGYGNPLDLWAEDGTELNISLKSLIEDAAISTGFLLQNAPDGSTPIISVDIREFWCDGYAGYKIIVVLDVKLLSPDRKKTFLTETITVENGFGLFGSYKPMYDAYDWVMNQIAQEVSDILTSTKFKKALEKV